jgi:hypothetical protein
VTFALKPIAFLVGLALLAAAAHVTIESTGGYGTPHAVLTMAIAAGVGIGALAIGGAFAAERQAVGWWLVAAIVAGELYGGYITAERLIAGREAQQAPLRLAQEAFARARQRAQEAEDAFAAAPVASPRLQAALAAKAAADAAAVEKSAERGCLVNCRQLLQAQVDGAAAEVAAARSEIETARNALELKLAAARAALTETKPPVSSTPMQDRTGIPQWMLDLVVSILGSMAANGLAAGLLAFAVHHRHQTDIAAATSHDVSKGSPRTDKSAPARQAHRRRQRVPIRLDPTGGEHAARFAVEVLERAKDGAADLMDILAAYRLWCQRTGAKPLSESDIGAALAALFESVGIVVAQQEGRFVARGIALSRVPQRQQLPVDASRRN